MKPQSNTVNRMARKMLVYSVEKGQFINTRREYRSMLGTKAYFLKALDQDATVLDDLAGDSIINLPDFVTRTFATFLYARPSSFVGGNGFPRATTTCLPLEPPRRPTTS
jgi:hypothetical protein